MTDRIPPGRRRTHRAVSSTVVAAATVGVTGLTLSWAVGVAAPSTGTAESAASRVSREIAADQAAITRLRRSITGTDRQLAEFGADGTTAPAASGSPGPSAPGAPGAPALAAAPGSAPVGTTNSAVGAATSSGGPVGAHSTVSAGAGSAPAPAATVPAPAAPAPTAPVATAPPPTAPPATSPPAPAPPPVTATTGASGAKV